MRVPLTLTLTCQLHRPRAAVQGAPSDRPVYGEHSKSWRARLGQKQTVVTGCFLATPLIGVGLLQPFPSDKVDDARESRVLEHTVHQNVGERSSNAPGR